MTVRPIVRLHPAELDHGRPPDGSVLGLQCAAVTQFGGDTETFIEDLLDTMFAHPVAVGLAAPQIGLAIQIAVINPTRETREGSLVLVNPLLMSISGKKDTKRESCMSLPYFAGEVERRLKVTVQYSDRNGEKQRLTAEGFLARVIQHEVEHLAGRLYTAAMKRGAGLEPTDVFNYPDPLGPAAEPGE